MKSHMLDNLHGYHLETMTYQSSDKRTFLDMVDELFQYRHLLLMLIWRDIRARYKQSVLGLLWAVFMPMMIVSAGILVRKAFSIISGTPLTLTDLVSVSVKALPWAFFVGSIRFATNSLTGELNLVTKIYFPREVLPLSSVLVHLFDFAVAFLVLAVLLAVVGVQLSAYLVWLPVLLVILVFFTAALGMVLACANLFFRDVKYIVEVVLTFAIFFTPVFYDARMFGEWAPLLLLNPVGAILEGINDVVIRQQSPESFWLMYSTCWALLGFLAAWRVFTKAAPAFAENV